MHEHELSAFADSPPARPWWRRWKVIAGLLIGLGITVPVISVCYLMHRADKELQAAVAEADRLDPGWRLEELEAKREVLPDEKNGMVVVQSARSKLPSPWTHRPRREGESEADYAAKRSQPETDVMEQVRMLPPEAALTPELSSDLKALLQEHAAALAEARKLVDHPGGRAVLIWAPDYVSTLVPHVQEAREITALLFLDAVQRAHSGDPDAALRSARAALNAGRAIGDEPFVISQLVRMACEAHSVRAIERTLAQGRPSEEALAVTQRLLADEAACNILLASMRGERAWQHGLMEAMVSGQASPAALRLGPTGLNDRLSDLVGGSMARQAHPYLLRALTEMVEIAKLPVHEQEARVKSWETANLANAPVWARLLLPALGKIFLAYRRSQAQLRCGVTALAAERYRLKHGRWPAALKDLTPDFLAEMPLDPYDGQPLRYRQTEDGVMIYAVGQDRKDDNGKSDRQNPDQAGTDIGIQLWNVDRRRQTAVAPQRPVDEPKPKQP